MKRILLALLGLTVVGPPFVGLAQERPHETEQLFILRPSLDPSRFTAEVTNPWFPLEPGSRYIYNEQTAAGRQRVEVTVLHETREVMGVTTRVVHDRVTKDGELIEDTYDWYAQDEEGNVWYFGEDSKEYQGGELVSTDGSWEAGVDGAVPGIVMLAEPTPGDTYRQEYLPAQAVDMGQVLELNGAITVPYGAYQDLLVTYDWDPLEPGLLERKYYAKGLGLVAEELVEGGSERVELIDLQRQ